MGEKAELWCECGEQIWKQQKTDVRNIFHFQIIILLAQKKTINCKKKDSASVNSETPNLSGGKRIQNEWLFSQEHKETDPYNIQKKFGFFLIWR